MAIFSRKLLKDELSFGLTRLSASENMDTFRGKTTDGSESIELAAGEELSLPNQFLARGIIPQGYWIYKQTGNGLVTAGDTAWTTSAVSLKNHGAATVTVNLLFLARI